MAQRINFEKLTPDGKGIGYWQDKAIFAEGPIPGETAWIRVSKQHPTYSEGSVKRITITDPARNGSPEEHYLSCAPWQDIAYPKQLELKAEMLKEAYGRLDVEVAESIVGAPAADGYRNKIGFSLAADANGMLQLAMHERGQSDELIGTPDGCRLAHPGMNNAAIGVLARLNTLDIPNAAEAITIRYSQAQGGLLAIVTVNEAPDVDWSVLADEDLTGVAVVLQSGPRERQILWSRGALELTERVGNIDLIYAWDSFFQVNPAAFEAALSAIVGAVPAGAKILDLYGGVGTIGLGVAGVASQVTGVEVDATAVRLASANAAAAGLGNYRAEALGSEKLSSNRLAQFDAVIVDPPRAGLHRKLVEAIIDARPERLVYLSCNPITQARDLARLLPYYSAGPVTGFDFYPGTLHLESLVVLTRLP